MIEFLGKLWSHTTRARREQMTKDSQRRYAEGLDVFQRPIDGRLTGISVRIAS